MAAISSKSQTSVLLKYKTGIDQYGKDVFKNQKFSNVKTTALDQDIYDTATSIGTLLSYPVSAIEKDDLSTIINQ